MVALRCKTKAALSRGGFVVRITSLNRNFRYRWCSDWSPRDTPLNKRFFITFFPENVYLLHISAYK